LHLWGCAPAQLNVPATHWSQVSWFAGIKEFVHSAALPQVLVSQPVRAELQIRS
jgi:hypothetical protein